MGVGREKLSDFIDWTKNPFRSWLLSNSLLPTKLKEAPPELFTDGLLKIVLGDA